MQLCVTSQSLQKIANDNHTVLWLVVASLHLLNKPVELRPQLLKEPLVATQTEEAVISRRAYLEQTVYLLAPTLGTWHGVYHLPREDTETKVKGASVQSSDITTPQAKLLTKTYPLDSNGKPWKARLDGIHTQLEKAKSKFSVRFSINGIRIVPKAKITQFLHELYGDSVGDLQRKLANAETMSDYGTANTIRRRLSTFAPNTAADTPVADTRGSNSINYQLRQIRDEFVNTWEDIRRQIADHSSVYEQIKTKIPDVKVIGSKFYLDVTPIELSGGGGRETDIDDFLTHQHNVQEACQRRIDEAVEEILEGPRAELTDALTDLETLISRSGQVTDRSFGAARRAIDKMKMFDFSLTPELMERVKRAERLVNNATPKSLNGDVRISGAFQKELSAVREALNQDAAVEDAYRQFGVRPRLLDL